jgi:hypothetical protein
LLLRSPSAWLLPRRLLTMKKMMMKLLSSVALRNAFTMNYYVHRYPKLTRQQLEYTCTHPNQSHFDRFMYWTLYISSLNQKISSEEMLVAN